MKTAGEDSSENFSRHAATDRDAKDWTLTTIAGSEVDRVSIRRDDHLVNLLIEPARELHTGSGSAVVSHQAPAIRLKPCGRLRAIQDKLSVARVDWTGIVTVVANGDILRWATCDGHHVNVAIGRDRFDFIRIA